MIKNSVLRNDSFYNEVVAYHSEGVIPSALTAVQRKRFRETANLHFYDPLQKRSIRKSDNLIALPPRVCHQTIRELHFSHHHPLTSDLFKLARSRFAAYQLRDSVCQAVINDCLRCQERFLPRRTSDPMRHLTVEQRKEVATLLGLQPFNSPTLSDAADLHPTKFVPRTQNRMSVHYNCVCACISFLLTIIIKERTGANSHLYDLPGGSQMWTRPDDVDFVSITD